MKIEYKKKEGKRGNGKIKKINRGSGLNREEKKILLHLYLSPLYREEE